MERREAGFLSPATGSVCSPEFSEFSLKLSMAICNLTTSSEFSDLNFRKFMCWALKICWAGNLSLANLGKYLLMCLILVLPIVQIM
jgi:hypothetical protein